VIKKFPIFWGWNPNSSPYRSHGDIHHLFQPAKSGNNITSFPSPSPTPGTRLQWGYKNSTAPHFHFTMVNQAIQKFWH
jgi:hypothetical protein